MNASIVNGSFRDPMGFVFKHNDEFYRQINDSYQAHYTHLMESGLYLALTAERVLLSHETAPHDIKPMFQDGYKIIKPTQLEVLSYPYEWSFSQLRDAALTTLHIQKKALEYDMTLKDASCFNIQFLNGRPVLIDTLSFEKYEEGQPWQAYRQFCQHFLAPLALMSYVDIRLGQIWSNFIDGLPLDLAAKLLPVRAKFNFSLYMHIFLHAKAQQKYKTPSRIKRKIKLSKLALFGLIDSLESGIKKLAWTPVNTTWFDYYENNNNYGDKALLEKEQIIQKLASEISPKKVWDLGANVGRFSRIFAKCGSSSVVSWDIDPACVELNYLETKRNDETNILPLYLDLTNPTSSIGWACHERASFIDRGPVDLVLALGLVHHLAIGNNVPLPKIFELFATLSRRLIIEFIPKEDSNAQKLLANRKDIFENYHLEGFEKAAKEFFTIESQSPVSGTMRTIYSLKKR